MYLIKVSVIVIFLSNILYSKTEPKYYPHIVPKKMSIDAKKDRFYYLITPAVDKVYNELMEQYNSVKHDIKEKKT